MSQIKEQQMTASHVLLTQLLAYLAREEQTCDGYQQYMRSSTVSKFRAFKDTDQKLCFFWQNMEKIKDFLIKQEAEQIFMDHRSVERGHEMIHGVLVWICYKGTKFGNLYGRKLLFLSHCSAHQSLDGVFL